jgi:hypothetical protein
MSRGLSVQQHYILGLAVTVSRHRHGKPRAWIAEPHPRWTVPVVVDGTPDIDIRICTHVLGQVTLRHKPTPATLGWATQCGGWLETTPAALSVRASLSRAITSLRKRGQLAIAVTANGYDTGGYCLTAQGLETGRTCQRSIPDLGYRLDVLNGDSRTVLTVDLPPPRLAGV